MIWHLLERKKSNTFLWKSYVADPRWSIDMPKIATNCFTVIYIPFYSLQCAQQKRLLQGTYPDHMSSRQLSLNVTLEDSYSDLVSFPVFEEIFADIPAALLDQNGIHVIELNPAAERAGIRPGSSTSQAIA